MTPGQGPYPMIVGLSTTPLAVNALNSSFAENIGPDNTVVYSSTWNMGVFAGENSPLQFQFVVPFSTPFFYNPINGNLLLDIQITNWVNSYPGTGPAPMQVNYNGGYPNTPLMCRVFGYGNQFSPAPTSGGVFTWSGLITEFGLTPVKSPSYQIGELNRLLNNAGFLEHLFDSSV